MHGRLFGIVIVHWPAGSEPEWRAEQVISRFGTTAPHALAVAEAEGAVYVAAVQASSAPGVIRRLAMEGIRAVALPHDELRLGLSPLVLRRLTPLGDGVFMGEMRRMPAARIAGEDVRLLVRGTVWREGSAKGVVELLDIHLREGLTYRCDASDFAFVDVLQPLSHTDGENTDRLALHLAAHAPRAEVDTGFNRAKWMAWAPRGLVGPGLLGTKVTRATDKSFDFYSMLMRCVNECRRGRRRAVPE